MRQVRLGWSWVFLANRSPGQAPNQWIYFGHRKPHRRRAIMSLHRFGFIALRNSRGGRIKEGQSQKGPAPPSFPRLGALVAPQRCPILRAGKNNSSTERFTSDILKADRKGLAYLPVFKAGLVHGTLNYDF